MVTTIADPTIVALLRDLRGGGFNTSLLIRGAQLVDQKIVAFDGNVLFTVDATGVARATRISHIDSVDF